MIRGTSGSLPSGSAAPAPGCTHLPRCARSSGRWGSRSRATHDSSATSWPGRCWSATTSWSSTSVRCRTGWTSGPRSRRTPSRHRASRRRPAPGRSRAQPTSSRSVTASPRSWHRSSRVRSAAGRDTLPTSSRPSRACCSWPTCWRRSTGRWTSSAPRRSWAARIPTRRRTWSGAWRLHRRGAARRPRRPASIRGSRTTTHRSR